MAWWNLGVAAVSTATSLYASSSSKTASNKALDANQQAIDRQQTMIANLQYQPIDIEKLKTEATQNAITNATNSLALERSLTPDIANARAELSKQTSAQLALGGKLGADTINTVNQAGRVAGSNSGIGSGSMIPLTAGLLGINSMDLANQRRAAASDLVNQNPLPIAGLDPGQIASAEIGNNNALNQFNANKAGLNSNLIGSQLGLAGAQQTAAGLQTGANVGVASSLANLIGTGISAYSGSTSNPSTSPYTITGNSFGPGAK